MEGGGEGARVSEFFYKGSKSKKNNLFFLGEGLWGKVAVEGG